MTSRDNDDSTVEILLNQRLRELSNDIPDRDGMRARALQRLLLDYAEQGKPENAKPSRFAGRPVMIVVLALVATVGIVALLPSAQTTLVETSVGSSSTSTTPVVQASDPTSSTTEARPVETTSSSDLGTLTVEPDSSAVGMFDQGFNLGALELSFAATSTQMEQTGWILESELTDQVMFRIPNGQVSRLAGPNPTIRRTRIRSVGNSTGRDDRHPGPGHRPRGIGDFTGCQLLVSIPQSQVQAWHEQDRIRPWPNGQYHRFWGATRIQSAPGRYRKRRARSLVGCTRRGDRSTHRSSGRST